MSLDVSLSSDGLSKEESKRSGLGSAEERINLAKTRGESASFLRYGASTLSPKAQRESLRCSTCGPFDSDKHLNVSWRTLQVGTKQDMGHRGMMAPAEKWRNTKAVYFPPTTPTSPPMEAKFSRSIRFVTPNPSHTKVCTAVIQYFHTIRHRGCKLSSLVSHFSWLDRFDLKPPSWPGLSSPSSFLPRHSHSRSRTGSPTI